MKTLSLSRPWTELVLAGHKSIENRTWATPYRGLLVIHGALSWDPVAAVETARPVIGAVELAALDYRGALLKETCPTGFLGVVDLTFICRPTHRRSCTCGPWAFRETHHWHVENPRRLPEPIPGPGRLGLFTPPAEVIAAVRELEETQK